jgi:hypothetical protein
MLPRNRAERHDAAAVPVFRLSPGMAISDLFCSHIRWDTAQASHRRGPDPFGFSGRQGFLNSGSVPILPANHDPEMTSTAMNLLEPLRTPGCGRMLARFLRTKAS